MAENALTITLASITDDNGRVSARVTNSNNKRAIRFNVRIRSAGTAPADQSLYKFYFHRLDDEGTTHSDDTVGESDAALSTEPDNSLFAGTLILTASTNTNFETSFLVYDPGPYWSLSMWNASGQTINVSGHYLRYVYTD